MLGCYLLSLILLLYNYLGWNQIGDEGAFAIAKMMNESRILRSLNLRGNFLIYKAIFIFHIECGISVEGAKAIAEAIPSSSLTCLNICMSWFDYPMLTDGFAAWNKIGDEGAIAIAETFYDGNNLEELNLYGNNLTDKSNDALAASLSDATSSLKVLGLGLSN